MFARVEIQSDRSPPRPGEIPDSGDELDHVERLSDHSGDRSVRKSLDELRRCRRGRENGGKFDPGCLELLQNGESVQLRHHEVEEEEIEMLVAELIDRIVSIGREHDIESIFDQDSAEHDPDGGFIVGDQDARHGGTLCSARAGDPGNVS